MVGTRDLMGIVTPTPPVMGKLLFYCAAWLYLPPLCRASGSRLSLSSLSLALSRLLVSSLAHETPLDARMIGFILSTMLCYLIHIFAMPPSRHSWATALHKRWQKMGVLWWRNLVFWSSAAGFVFLVVVVVVAVSLFLPFSFWGVAKLLLVVIDPGIKLLRQVGFHSAAGFGRNELRKSVVLSFSFGLAVFVFLFGFLGFCPLVVWDWFYFVFWKLEVQVFKISR